MNVTHFVLAVPTGLIDQQLKVHRTEPFVSVVLDVVGPGLAFDVDDDATNWAHKVHCDERAEISLGVFEGIVVAWEASSWEVLDFSNVFNVGRVLALARHPDSVHSVLFPFLNSLDVLLQVTWHVAWQTAGGIVELRNPAVDLVQLQEYARGALVVVVFVLQGARSVLLDVHIAHGPRWWRLGVITVVDVLSSARNLTGCPVV